MSDQAAYDVESILLRLKELVEAGRSMPMSASVLVNREETLEINLKTRNDRRYAFAGQTRNLDRALVRIDHPVFRHTIPRHQIALAAAIVSSGMRCRSV